MKAKELVQCGVCSRRFTGDRIKIHEAICEKSSCFKRHSFDVSEQRVRGTEIENFLKTTAEVKAPNENNKKRSTLSTNWRWKHNDFIKKIQNLKDQALSSKKHSGLSKKESPELNEFIQCPHCWMKFSQPAAQRHMIICAKMMNDK